MLHGMLTLVPAQQSLSDHDTVDGRHPAPLGMYKTL